MYAKQAYPGSLLRLPYSSWWSIKNDYRTLVGLEGVNLVDTYASTEERD
jgi:hypothetical protein